MTGGETLRKLKKYTPTKFMAKGSHYDKAAADYVVNFIEQLRHTKGEFYNQPFALIDWQERIIRDIFGTLRSDDYRQFNTAYIEISKKSGKESAIIGGKPRNVSPSNSENTCTLGVLRMT